jgi:hypothetical protein
MKLTLLAFLYIAFASALFAESTVDIVARTVSGRRVVLTSVEASTTVLMLGPSSGELSIDDPVVDIVGLTELELLEELTIVLLPQIAEFGFLSSLSRIERLTVSHCRLSGLEVLVRLPQLRKLRIEMCRNPQGGTVLASDRLDLSRVPLLETLILLDCGIRNAPHLVNVPSGLEHLDLSWNELRLDTVDEPALRSWSSIAAVLLAGAAVPERISTAYPNLVTRPSR